MIYFIFGSEVSQNKEACLRKFFWTK